MVTRQMSARQWYISIQLRNLDSGGDLVSKVGGHIRWRSQEGSRGWGGKIEGEARIEGAERPRIEGEARDLAGRGLGRGLGEPLPRGVWGGGSVSPSPENF